jgi:SAM-dependent methyltransferase
MHLNCDLLFKKYALEHFKDNALVLEIGPDIIPSTLSLMVGNPTITWESLNLAIGEETSRTRNSQLTILADNEYAYPIADNTYDIVISANVLEHVKKFWKWFEELKRIVKPGGLIITIAPVSWPYHEAPVDCWRIYPDGIRALYEDIGLTDVFTTFESLEKEQFADTNTPVIPWATNINKKKAKIINSYNTVLKFIPFSKALRVPMPVAYDLITIASKDAVI